MKLCKDKGRTIRVKTNGRWIGTVKRRGTRIGIERGREPGIKEGNVDLSCLPLYRPFRLCMCLTDRPQHPFPMHCTQTEETASWWQLSCKLQSPHSWHSLHACTTHKATCKLIRSIFHSGLAFLCPKYSYSVLLLIFIQYSVLALLLTLVFIDWIWFPCLGSIAC